MKHLTAIVALGAVYKLVQHSVGALSFPTINWLGYLLPDLQRHQLKRFNGSLRWQPDWFPPYSCAVGV